MTRFTTLILLSIFFYFFSTYSSAQTRDSSSIADSLAPRTAWNNLYLELAGSNFWGSVNYERLINDNWSIRIGGYPYARTDSAANQYYQQTNQLLLGANLVCTASHLIGSGNHKLEIGGGFTAFIPPLYGTGLGMLAGILGYRFQPKGGGFLFRIAFTPLIFHNVTLLQGGGLSIAPIGYTTNDPGPGIYSSPLLPWIGLSLGGTF